MENNMKKEGNYIRSNIRNGELDLEDVWTEYCKPKHPKCGCKSLLDTILTDYTKLDTILLTFAAHPIIAGCRCYLGAAARKGFKYVTVKSGRSECDGEKPLNKNNYVVLCNYYKEHNCVSKGLSIVRWTITKQKTT